MEPRSSIALVLATLISAATADLRLTEFQARGESRWVELQHPGSETIDLAGFELRTSPHPDAAAEDVWVFPAIALEPGSHLTIGLGSSPGEANLDLERSGGYLALASPEGTILTAYENYPKQRDDVSFGLDPADPERQLYFENPTPGEANENGILGFVEDTVFSLTGGFYDAPIELEITSATPDAIISYTTNGSIPGVFNANSRLYEGPIEIGKSTVIRAHASKLGYAGTDLDTHTYLFLDDVLDQPEFPEGFPESWGDGPGVTAPLPNRRSDYEVDQRIRQITYKDMDGQEFALKESLQSLPSLSLVMPIGSLLDPDRGLHALAQNKGREWERPMSLEYFEADGQRAFQINGGFRMQGGWNRHPESFKKSFRFYFRSEYGAPKLRYPLFPDTAVDTFDTLILRAGNGKAWSSPWRSHPALLRVTYLRDQLPRDLQHDMGHPTSHGSFVHLYINGLYWGLYNLVERVDEWFGPGYLGGDEDDYDVIKWIRSEGMVISAGNADAWNDLLRLVRGNVASAQVYQEVAALLDMENLIDYMLINFYIGNSDWPDNNAYTFRQRAEDGRFRFVCWDSEESLLSTSANSLGRNNTSTPAEVFRRLLRNDEFRVLLMDRIQEHFADDGVLTDAHVRRRFMDRAREIDRGIVGESARWGDLLRTADPYTRDDWINELDLLQQSYFGLGDGSREEITLDQMKFTGWTSKVGAPALRPRDRYLPQGTPVEIRKKSIFTSGTLYYTTDGTDPRLPGGAINPAAIPGTTTILLEASTLIKARILSLDSWGPLTQASYHIGLQASAANTTITELMYHPVSDAEPEFIELTNTSSAPVNLRGSKFDQGIRFEFMEDAVLQPGESVILTNDTALFAQRYGSAVRVLGEFDGGTRLSNGGETVTLLDIAGDIIASVSYSDEDPWPEEADGEGYSLVHDGAEWRLSQEKGGSPGSAGRANLIDAALASSPIIVTTDSGNRHLVVERWSRMEDVVLSLQVSSDLKTWTTLSDDPALLVPIDDLRERLEWMLPAAEAASTSYARLLVEEKAPPIE